MRRLIVFMTLLLVVSLTSATGSLALSSGCDVFNRAQLDGQYIQMDVVVSLETGEVLSFTADTPTSGDAPTGIGLRVGPSGTAPQDLPEVDSASFPGTVTYMVPADGDYAVLWTTKSASPDPLDATWDLSCELPEEEPDTDGWNSGQCVSSDEAGRAADPSTRVGPGVFVNGTLHSPLDRGGAPFDRVAVCPKAG